MQILTWRAFQYAIKLSLRLGVFISHRCLFLLFGLVAILGDRHLCPSSDWYFFGLFVAFFGDRGLHFIGDRFHRRSAGLPQVRQFFPRRALCRSPKVLRIPMSFDRCHG